MKIFVVLGEHYHVPGIVTSAHRTSGGAENKALELVNLMLKDSEQDETTDWRHGLELLQEQHGAGDCDVVIWPLELED